DNKEAPLQAQLSAFGTLQGSVSALNDATSALATSSKFNAFTARAADSTVASASSSSAAVAGTHSIEVDKLAQAQTLASATAYPSTGTVLGSGTITIQFGAYNAGSFTPSAQRATQTITIAPNQSSLSSVRDAINAADAGVTASLVNDGTGYRL